MNQVLRGVVNGRDGTAHLARVADFTVAGKTGTAQMVNPATGTYYRDRLVASFVGFVPAEDPKLVILVVLYDVPHGRFGGLVAAPVFSEIASDALQRMAVAPAHPPVESASLLPIGNGLGFFSPPEDHDSNSAADNEGMPSGFTEQHRAESATDELREDNPRMPDFRGLSLRSALAVARNHELALEVKGDGYVVSQEPMPGVPEKSTRWLNPKRPTSGVQIVLAAPDEKTSHPLPPVESAFSRRAAALRAAARAFSLPAGPSQSRRRRLAARSFQLRREPRGRHCSAARVVGARCIAR